MRYSEIIQRAFSAAWKYKYLWILGFFADLTGSLSILQEWRQSRPGRGWQEWNQIRTWDELRDLAGWDNVGWFAGVTILLIFFILMVVVALLIIERICEGGLITNAGLLRLGEPHNLSTAWQGGSRYFLRMMGLLLLQIMLVLGLIIAIIGFLIILGVGLGGLMVLLALVFILPLFFAALFVVFIIFSYAERFIVLENNGVVDALKSAAVLWKQKFGKSVAMGLIAVGIMICFTFVLIMLFLLLFIPVFALWLFSPVLAILFAIFIALPPAAVVAAYLGAYRSLLWSFFFLELRAPAVTDVSAAAAPAAG